MGGRMSLPDAPIAHEGFFAAHFFTMRDQEKSKDFYVRILGGRVIKPDDPCYIKLANSWIILNSGGGPTPDKPEVLLETPADLNRMNSFLNLRVADIWSCYKQWRDKGALFLTEPLNNRAGNGAATCAIPTATSSRSANMLNSRSTISRTTPVENAERPHSMGKSMPARAASSRPKSLRFFFPLTAALYRNFPVPFSVKAA
jgi:hypothetical protein